jgi:hypothetical protein
MPADQQFRDRRPAGSSRGMRQTRQPIIEEDNVEPKMTEIRGIGASTALGLEGKGLTRVKDVANASVDQVAAIQGFGPVRAARVIAAAAALLAEAASSVESPPAKQAAKGGKAEKKVKRVKKEKEKKQKKSKKEKKKAKGKSAKKDKKSKNKKKKNK